MVEAKKIRVKEIEDVIKKEIVEIKSIDKEDILDQSNIALDLEFDSLDFIELIMYIEKDLSISINDNDFSGEETVKELSQKIYDSYYEKT
ncbi:MAG TPA: acyl carrier protein [bacterium]|nr:acyl carrier protein [bacterium]